MEINLCELYPGFDGEVNAFGQGTPTIFIRFQGCNLRCSWCDTKFAQDKNIVTNVPLEEIITQIINTKNINKVTITGGEPILQKKELKLLIEQLFYLGYKISVETNGSLAWAVVDGKPLYWVHCWLIDYKLPSSIYNHLMLKPEYFAHHTGQNDFIKFVIGSQDDFIKAIEIQKEMQFLGCMARFAYSTTEHIDNRVLADWMLNKPEILDKAVLNCQIHKFIWAQERKR